MISAAVGARTSDVILNALPDAPSRARQFISALLEKWGLTDEETGGDAALLVSEVTTNAIHETGRDSGPVEPGPGETVTVIQVRARVIGTDLTVEVWDSSPARPKPQTADADADDGRGLFLVEALAADWGTTRKIIGKVVWFRLIFPAPDPDASLPEQRPSPDGPLSPSHGI